MTMTTWVGIVDYGKAKAQAEFFGDSLGPLQEPASRANSMIIRRRT
jgi:hypothetical protein